MTWLVQTAAGGWELGVGDPTFAGWLIFACYFAGSALCWQAARGARAFGPAAERLAVGWTALCAAMSLLGVNKQLDLQSLFMLIGKQLAREEGWYANRHAVQRVFVIGLALLCLGLGAAFFRYMRNHVKQFWLAGLGVAILGCFVLIRASSFQHVGFDEGDAGDALDAWLNAVFELAGIACVAINARIFALKAQRSLARRGRSLA